MGGVQEWEMGLRMRIDGSKFIELYGFDRPLEHACFPLRLYLSMPPPQAPTSTRVLSAKQADTGA